MLPLKGFTGQPVLRIYPPRFARAVCDLVESMKRTSRGQPQLPMESTPPAIETIQLDWEFDPSLWQFVDFREVFTYLRGSTNLKIPEPWKTIIPRKVWWISESKSEKTAVLMEPRVSKLDFFWLNIHFYQKKKGWKFWTIGTRVWPVIYPWQPMILRGKPWV